MKIPFPSDSGDTINFLSGLFRRFVFLCNAIAVLGFGFLVFICWIGGPYEQIQYLNFFNLDLSLLSGRIFFLFSLFTAYIFTMGFISTLVEMASNIAEIRRRLFYLPISKENDDSVIENMLRLLRNKGQLISLSLEINSVETNPFLFGIDTRFNQLSKIIAIEGVLNLNDLDTRPKFLRKVLATPLRLNLTFLNNIDSSLNQYARLGDITIFIKKNDLSKAWGEIFLPMDAYDKYQSLVVRAKDLRIGFAEKWYRRLYITGKIENSNRRSTEVYINNIDLDFFKHLSQDIETLRHPDVASNLSIN